MKIQETRGRRFKQLMRLMTGAAVAGAPVAYAQLAITNGDFENGGGANIEDVTDWFDLNNGTFFEGTWESNAQSPNGTNIAIFSSTQSEPFGAPSTEPNDGGYLYQAIGTADGQESVILQFDWGSPTDDDINRDLGVTVGIYAYDGVGEFTAADETDVRGGAGVTLLDSVTFTSAAGTRPAGGILYTEVAGLDLSGAGSQQLFLRFNGYNPTATGSWPVLDNILIIPESDVPVFVAQPDDLFGFVGDTVTIVSQAVSEPSPTFQWEFSSDGSDPWSELAGETANSLTLDPASLADNGFYRVVATNVNGTVTSDDALLDFIYPDPTIVQQPNSPAVLAGATANISVTATGLGNLTYQWFKVEDGEDVELQDEGNISGTTTPTLQISGVSPADEGEYFVFIEDDAAIEDEGSPTESFSEGGILTIGQIPITASESAPVVDSADQFYFPEVVDDADNVGAGDDAFSYVAFDRPSKGMSFTTGSDPSGYSINAISVQQVLNPTFIDVQPGDIFEIHVGTLSGETKTIIFESSGAFYTGDPLQDGGGTGAGTFFTFDLSGAAIGTLSPDTTYYFEITTGTGDAYFDWNGTSADGYAAGEAFGGDTAATINPTYVAMTGDRAFHVDLTTMNGPSADFASWIAGFPGVGALDGFDDDPDDDGLTNGEENFMGTDPTVFNQGVVEARKSGDTFSFEHPQNPAPASDVSIEYRWSVDLNAWNADGATDGSTTVDFTASPNTPEVGTTTVTAAISGTVPEKLFTVLEVTQDAP